MHLFFSSLLFFALDSSQKRSCVLGNTDLIEKILAYGRELKALSVELKQEHGTNPRNKRALQVNLSVCLYLCKN